METRNFPASRISLFASEKSAGKKNSVLFIFIKQRGNVLKYFHFIISGKVIESSLYGKLKLEEFTFELASQLDVCLLAVGGYFSLEWAQKLAAKGIHMI